jgi:hypothetical protein
MSRSASFLKVKKLLQVASGRFAFPYPEHVVFSLLQVLVLRVISLIQYLLVRSRWDISLASWL